MHLELEIFQNYLMVVVISGCDLSFFLGNIPRVCTPAKLSEKVWFTFVLKEVNLGCLIHAVIGRFREKKEIDWPENYLRPKNITNK